MLAVRAHGTSKASCPTGPFGGAKGLLAVTDRESGSPKLKAWRTDGRYRLPATPLRRRPRPACRVDGRCSPLSFPFAALFAPAAQRDGEARPVIPLALRLVARSARGWKGRPLRSRERGRVASARWSFGPPCLRSRQTRPPPPGGFEKDVLRSRPGGTSPNSMGATDSQTDAASWIPRAQPVEGPARRGSMWHVSMCFPGSPPCLTRAGRATDRPSTRAKRVSDLTAT